jgi:cytochrome c oxidase assembly factor CtaG
VSVSHLLLDWTGSAALVPVLVTAGLYLLGTRALRRRGDAWSARRTVSTMSGLLVVAWATSGGLAEYDESYFSVHMAQHMLLAMIGPLLLALGAPVTLALRTLPARPRRWLLAVLHSRAAAVLAFPAVGWLLFVGNPFVLYFSGLYPATLDHPLLHVWLHAHFLVVGCLFLWPLVGLDPVPGRVAHGFRVLLVLVALPFHAFLGVAIMSRSDLIAADHYRALHRASDAALLADQKLGGGLLWAMGDLIGLLLLVALLAQWMRADERTARRGDRQADRDDDAALEDANARLAALARGGPDPRTPKR